ncbi:PGF-CTERM sorting domain-containing protein [Methanophagales archaeon]|nr:MAG: PGF-CTERM sorting domain-containing protein [Methanophagales archaeon]
MKMVTIFLIIVTLISACTSIISATSENGLRDLLVEEPIQGIILENEKDYISVKSKVLANYEGVVDNVCADYWDKRPPGFPGVTAEICIIEFDNITNAEKGYETTKNIPSYWSGYSLWGCSTTTRDIGGYDVFWFSDCEYHHQYMLWRNENYLLFLMTFHDNDEATEKAEEIIKAYNKKIGISKIPIIGETPGFEAIFAIVGLLAFAYIALRKREGK